MSNCNERNYGIDLARLVFMFLICLHHVLSQGGVLNNNLLYSGNIYSVLYAVTMIGVDGFALISGYVAKNKPQRYDKIISMWFQVFFYSLGLPLGINILRLIFGTEAFNIYEIISGLFPVLNHIYWYFDAYIVLFFFIPILNKALFDLNKNTSKKYLVILFALMFVMWKNNEMNSHNFLSAGGRSAFWLIILYSVGLLIKRINFLNKVKTWILFIVFCILITISLYYVKGNALSIENTYPTIWAAAIIIVIIFSRFKPNISIIAFLSPLSFGVYLFHENEYYKYYFMSERYLYSTNLLTINGFASVMLFTIATFMAGLFADYVRKQCFKLLNVDACSKKIVRGISDLLDKIISI